jgi:DNA-binding CsgD family transcriptional regulator
MGKSTLLSRAEVLDVMRFVGDVAAHKADPAAQRLFLIDGIQRLGECDIGFTYTGVNWRPGLDARLVSAVFSTQSHEVFSRYTREVLLEHGLNEDPFCPGTVGLNGTRDVDGRGPAIVAVGRRDVLPDLDAERRHGRFVEYGTRARLGDGIVCFARLDDVGIGSGPGPILGVGIHRTDGGQTPMPERPRARVRLAIAECAALIARGHLSMPELAPAPAVPGGHARANDAAHTNANGGAGSGVNIEAIVRGSRLSRRPREVLHHLLAGASPKQIARTMDVSVWTVRDHIANLYAHFNVHGRDELMALFVLR